MVDRFVSVGDNLTLPSSVKVADANLPAHAKAAALSGVIKGVVSLTAPTNPTAGMVWFDTTPAVPEVLDTLDQMSGLLARWRANDLTAADGSNVATVSRRKGSTTTALTQTTAGNQPTLLHNFVNGKKAIQFTAANADYMTMSLPALDTPITVFGVLELDSPLSYVYSGQSSTKHVGMLTNTGGTTIRINTTENLGGGVSTPWTNAGPVIVAAVYTPGAGTARFYYNKLTAVTGTTHSAVQTAIGAMSVGRGPTDYPAAYSDMKLADLAFVTGSVTDANVKTVMQELATYYGIALGA